MLNPTSMPITQDQNNTLNSLKSQLQAASQKLSTMKAPTISAASLQSPQTPLNVPQYSAPVLPNFTPSFSQNLATDTQNAKSAMDSSLADVGATLDKLGTQTQRQQQLETQAGIPALNTRLTDLNALDAQYAADLTNLQSQTLQSQLKSEDRRAPMFAITGEQAQAARQSAFLAQNINIQRSTNAAAISAASGQLALAQNYVQKALDYEFKPLEYQLQFKQMVYENNKDQFSKAEQRQYDAQLAQEQRQLDLDKYNREGVLSIVTKLAQYGAPETAIQAVSAAKDPMAAIAAAGQYLQDPAAKLDLEKTKLDMLLTKATLDKVRKETAQIGRPTPAQAAEATKQAKAEAAAKQSELDKATQALTIIQQLKTGFVPTQTSSGTSLPGVGSRAVGPISSKILTVKGDTADFERAHDQLRSLLSLDNFKLLKGSGAISDKEGALLSAAASQLDLNMSEAGYQRELDKLYQTFNTVVAKSSTLAPEDQAILDAYWADSSPSQSLPAENYFRN